MNPAAKATPDLGVLGPGRMGVRLGLMFAKAGAMQLRASGATGMGSMP